MRSGGWVPLCCGFGGGSAGCSRRCLAVARRRQHRAVCSVLLPRVESVWKEGTGPSWDNDRHRRKLLEDGRTVCFVLSLSLSLEIAGCQAICWFNLLTLQVKSTAQGCLICGRSWVCECEIGFPMGSGFGPWSGLHCPSRVVLSQVALCALHWPTGPSNDWSWMDRALPLYKTGATSTLPFSEWSTNHNPVHILNPGSHHTQV